MVTFTKVNVDTQTDIAQAYGITAYGALRFPRSRAY